MEDCLHTSSENLSKLVSWAHSHGTICSLIPNLKHLLTEGSHGNLTAMWGCSAGHAYHWPLTATCKTGPKERCYQDSRSVGSDSLSLQGGSGLQPSPADRYLGRGSKGKADCGQTRDSCDFSNCSEPSEADDTGEDYSSALFDIVCESSATDEDGDYEPQAPSAARPPLRKRGPPGGRPRLEEAPGDAAVKRIKQESQEDYYIVANAQLGGGLDGVPVAPSPKQSSQRPPLSQGPLHKPPSADPPDPTAPSASPSGMPKPLRAPLPCTQARAPAPAPPHRPPTGPPLNPPLLPPPLPVPGELGDPLPPEELPKSCGPPLPFSDPDASPVCLHPDLEVLSPQALGGEPKAEASGKAPSR